MYATDSVRVGQNVYLRDYAGEFIGPFKVDSVVGHYANLRGPRPYNLFGHFVPGNTFVK